ncbi:ester cyclase [Aegicerativicinus sediminis]|uniref:ester cyclase n=1 Tax=Aegicerativicinus sediminis TaxID=2893202 RepID=UPI001E585707|nr:nuclear transport factor 2 family protein [Aegicerativicinus sediminis]
MKHTTLLLLATLIYCPFMSSFASNFQFHKSDSTKQAIEELNKKLALDFYHDLWTTDNTDNYKKYLADEYVAHDIGDRKNVLEPAIEQKIVADRFWDNGKMDFQLDYQIAEGDLVATRWTWNYKPETLMGKFMFGETSIPIINVFRIKDNKIVELWNHRHDIDTGMTKIFTLKGLAMGLLIALLPTIIVFRQRKTIKRLRRG